ncbi:hypothetical protein HY622_01995 [Candidatus Uhrbacteria bacterium]|nr:hypothetical protein [Candidatus Uhrbacteria bacterium]
MSHELRSGGEQQESSFAVVKELLAKRWRERKIDASEYADGCVQLFLEQQGSARMRDAYQAVQNSSFLVDLRDPQKKSFLSLTAEKKLIPPDATKEARRYLRAIDPKLDYVGFIASFVRTEGSVVGLQADRIHFEKIFRVIDGIPKAAVSRRALFYSALANHIAEYRMAAKASDLVFAPHVVSIQGGKEEQFLKDKLIGAPQNEGIEFCKEYRAYALPLLERQAAIVYGSPTRGREVLDLWNAVCHIKGESSVDELVLAEPRSRLLQAIMWGDAKEIAQATIDAARAHEAFIPFAQRTVGPAAVDRVKREVTARKKLEESYIDPATIKYHRRMFAPVFEYIAEQNKVIEHDKEAYEKLREYVGKVFVKKSVGDDEPYPAQLYAIEEGEPNARKEWYFDHKRKVRAYREIQSPQVVARMYEHKGGSYRDKGVKDSMWLRRAISGLNEATERYGNLLGKSE